MVVGDLDPVAIEQKIRANAGLISEAMMTGSVNDDDDDMPPVSED